MAKKDDSLSLLSIIKTVLEEAKLGAEPLSEQIGFFVNFGTGTEFFKGGYAFLFQEEGWFAFYIVFKKKVSKKYLSKVSEYINRVNYGLILGNFEMDYNDGEVRFKASVDFSEEKLTPEKVRSTIAIASDNVETYGKALIEVLEGQKTPEEAIASVEDTDNTD